MISYTKKPILRESKTEDIEHYRDCGAGAYTIKHITSHRNKLHCISYQCFGKVNGAKNTHRLRKRVCHTNNRSFFKTLKQSPSINNGFLIIIKIFH